MYSRPAKGNHQASWMLTVASKSYSEYVLVHLLPFLIVKHNQAHEALLTIQERAEINAKYHEGAIVRDLKREYRIGDKALRAAIQGPMRGNNKGYRVCPQCGGKKKWSKRSICRQCEIQRRRQLAASKAMFCTNCGTLLSQRKVGKCRACWLAESKKRRDPAAFDDRLKFETVLAFKKPEHGGDTNKSSLPSTATGPSSKPEIL